MLHPADDGQQAGNSCTGLCIFFSGVTDVHCIYSVHEQHTCTLTTYMYMHVQDNKQNLQIMMHSLLFQRAVCHGDGAMLAPRTLCLHELSETAAEHDVCL